MRRNVNPIGAQLGQDRLCELFAKLDSPLVERIDIPDDTLDKYFMLIHGNERAEGGGSELLEHDGVGGLVPCKDLVRNNLLDLVASNGGVSGELGADLGLGLAGHECLCLSEEVG
ncbi:hypothetical protein BC938DRAFT_479411 [Jimgerdemannia flammicorona]|uniref:Uncharacterized protein n=1 Tax=Jimgerdemannia flammicorona TaxID=994334 RepID=A0A433QKW1_9FUNG|nr:hypothetical protein BC938DRAFT_479411 [Jimgerdemannia flammicorona]